MKKMIKDQIAELMAQHPLVQKIAQTIVKQGGRVLLVGGAVRDGLLNLPIKDIDLEVHGIATQDLEKILQSYGPVSLVGKAYGVFRLHGLDVDWSLPRSDSAGRHPTVAIDPFMNMRDAFIRRDLTINAMGIDLITGELIDPFNGQDDLKQGILRAPDITFFVQDPLRFYRVMQFMSRFNMQPDAALTKICTTMDISAVSIERKEKEFEKLLLRSQRPSLGLRWLRAIGRLTEILPELAATENVAQDPHWHPEGDVFEHSMQAVDAAAQLPYADEHTKLIVMYAALFHDVGKAVTTQVIDGRIRSLGHDLAGVALTKNALQRIMLNKELSSAIQKLVRYHMQPGIFVRGGAKAPAYKRLASKLSPEVSLDILADLALADCRGRNGRGQMPLTTQIPDIDQFRKKAQELKILHKPEAPLLQGRDVMDIVPPGKLMGELLKKAYDLQLQEGITDKDELKRLILPRQR